MMLLATYPEIHQMNKPCVISLWGLEVQLQHLLRGLGGKTSVGENETEVNASGRGPSNANPVSVDEIKSF